MAGNVFTWIGIVVCLSQSALMSGLNLAVFSLGRLRLETEAANGNYDAQKVLRMREHPNDILSTIL